MSPRPSCRHAPLRKLERACPQRRGAPPGGPLAAVAWLRGSCWRAGELRSVCQRKARWTQSSRRGRASHRWLARAPRGSLAAWPQQLLQACPSRPVVPPSRQWQAQCWPPAWPRPLLQACPSRPMGHPSRPRQDHCGPPTWPQPLLQACCPSRPVAPPSRPRQAHCGPPDGEWEPRSSCSSTLSAAPASSCWPPRRRARFASRRSRRAAPPSLVRADCRAQCPRLGPPQSGRRRRSPRSARRSRSPPPQRWPTQPSPPSRRRARR
mmetsp:Transcript_92691/g.262236  ORF Transcript_92691/g.262236 Transcript_92691/m.262236 type:complete len:265 (-) Transcript_92691:144-938(-)